MVLVLSLWLSWWQTTHTCSLLSLTRRNKTWLPFSDKTWPSDWLGRHICSSCQRPTPGLSMLWGLTLTLAPRAIACSTVSSGRWRTATKGEFSSHSTPHNSTTIHGSFLAWHHLVNFTEQPVEIYIVHGFFLLDGTTMWDQNSEKIKLKLRAQVFLAALWRAWRRLDYL